MFNNNQNQMGKKCTIVVLPIYLTKKSYKNLERKLFVK